MSKLIDQFHTFITDRFKAQRQKSTIKNFTVDAISREDERGFAKLVKVFAKFEYLGWIDHGVKGPDEEKLADFVYSVKRAVAEEVFGEFRPLIIEMRNALYDEDSNRVRALLAELESRMFTI